jgi:hypothetical protein
MPRVALGLALLLSTGLTAAGGAQGARDASTQPKFTTQVLIVPAFLGADRGLASRGADIVRSRVAAAFPKGELRVISGGDMDDWFRRSGFEENPALSDGELKEMARKFRADERITGTLVRAPDGSVRIDASLSLIRDPRLAQPLVATAASVPLAAEAVAAEAIAARRQLSPLRQCENFDREGNARGAAAAATTAIALYPRAVPARVCLLNALSHLEVSADSVIAVSRATLTVAPNNAVALEDLAQALDSKGQFRDGAPIWTKLLATDSTSEAMIEKVVNALAREGFPNLAVPIIDRGTDAHPDNLPLLKVRWLVHLAENDWKGAILAGEQMLARDRSRLLREARDGPAFGWKVGARACRRRQRRREVSRECAAVRPLSAAPEGRGRLRAPARSRGVSRQRGGARLRGADVQGLGQRGRGVGRDQACARRESEAPSRLLAACAARG